MWKFETGQSNMNTLISKGEIHTEPQIMLCQCVTAFVVSKGKSGSTHLWGLFKDIRCVGEVGR